MSEEKVKIQHSREELDAAAAREADINRRLGKANDGSFVIIEMNRATGEQTLISAPNLTLPLLDENGQHRLDPETGEPMYRWQVLMLPSKDLALSWVAERGEQNYGYLILEAVASASGTKTPEELAALAEQDAEAMRSAGADE